MPRKKQGSIDLFVAYAHQDAELQSRLHTHLVSLQRAHLIQEIWYDKLIQAGGEWEKTIDKKLHAADIILLLISVDFLASDYCFGKEMQDALRLHEQGKTKVLPIILGACTWKHSPIAHIEVLPHKGKHVKSYADIDEALHEIIEKIAEVAQEIKERQDTELGRYRIAEEKRKQEEAKLLAKIEKERLENERLARLEPEIEQKKIQLDEMPIHKQYMYVQRVFTGNNVRFRIIVGKANAAHSKQEIEEIIDKYILSNPDIRPKDSVVEEFIGILRGRFI